MKTMLNSGYIKFITILATAIVAVTVAAGPASAWTVYSSSGATGTFSGQTNNICAGWSPSTMSSYAETITASPRYSAAQTIVQYTRVDYSRDSGRTWATWYWLPSQVRTATASSPAWFGFQSFHIPPSFSYRIVEGFYFYVGNTFIGNSWITFDRGDYYIDPPDLGVYPPIVSTPYSPGCTVVK